ncbi:MAG: thioredoxin [Muribaculaceae bacterium]
MAFAFNDENSKPEIESGKPVVIDFWAEWCIPCKKIAPIIDELAEQYEGRVKIGKYNVEESSDVATEFGIRSIPTILFFRDGKLVDKNVGSISKSNLEEKINALL